MINYIYHEENKFIEVKVSGKLCVQDVIKHYNKISKDNSLPNNLVSIIDCRNACFDIEEDELDDMVLTYDSVKNALKRFYSIKEAIVVDKPFETAVATIFSQINIGKYSCIVCNTPEKAMDQAKYWRSN